MEDSSKDLRTILPNYCPYIILESNYISEENFSCILRVKINNREEFFKWLRTFEFISNTNWNFRRSKAESNKFLFSRDYVCHHSSYNKKEKQNENLLKCKNKKCEAKLTVRIKYNTKDVRYKDKYVKQGYMAIININFVHSHIINNPESLHWLRRAPELKSTFLEYFSKGLSPSASIKFHECKILSEAPCAIANNGENPPNHWVYKLHNKWLLGNFEDLKGESSSSYIENSDASDSISKTHPCIVIMKSAHNHALNTAAELKQTNLFHEEHVISSALKHNTTDLMCEDSENDYKEGEINNWSDSTVSKTEIVIEKINSISESDFYSIPTITETDDVIKNVDDPSELISKIKDIFDRIEDGIKSNPAVFLPAAKKMIQNASRFASTDAGLVAAMCSFGCSTQSVLKQKQLKNTSRSYKTVIGTQPALKQEQLKNTSRRSCKIVIGTQPALKQKQLKNMSRKNYKTDICTQFALKQKQIKNMPRRSCKIVINSAQRTSIVRRKCSLANKTS